MQRKYLGMETNLLTSLSLQPDSVKPIIFQY